MINKIKKQNFSSLSKSHPDLFNSIQGNLEHLSTEDKGIVAGLVIEYVIQSGGNVDVFDDLDLDIEEEDFDEFE